MDLRLFHASDDPSINYKRLDRVNSRTGLLACTTLEWIGWYSGDVKHRLLGHYRLYQLYKKRRFKSSSALPAVQGYILQYRSSYWIKHYWYLFISRFPSVFNPDPQMEIYWINNILIHQRTSILCEFLSAADTDFEPAFRKAVAQIMDPEFIGAAGITKNLQAHVLVQVDQHTVNNNAHNELNIHPIVEKEKETTVKEIIIREPAAAKDLTGKEKGVFSKRQVLIFFDLLTETSKLEPVDISKTAKHPAIAQFFQALTGKTVETWLETLKDYRNDQLYTFNTPAERKNLLSVLENLATISRNAGFRSIASLADKKILSLEAKP